MARLYIDYTDTLFTNRRTGIQRVVKKILQHKHVFENFGFDAPAGVVQFYKGYYQFDASQRFPFGLSWQLHRFGGALRNHLDNFFAWVNSLSKRTETDTDVSDVDAPTPKSFERNAIHEKTVMFSRAVLKYLFKSVQAVDALTVKRFKVDFQKGDILFVPDAFWSLTMSVDLLAELKCEEVQIIVLLHDIFPLTHSDGLEQSFVQQFSSAFHKLLPIIDGYICNSRFTRNEVKKYLQTNVPELLELESAVFHLGYDFGPEMKVKKYFNQHLDTPNIYLMIGTLEPRKNHEYVLRAFTELWDTDDVQAKLCIVGHIDPNYTWIRDRIKQSVHYGEKLFLFEGVTDLNLAKFYSNCAALIFASSMEGFGLPLVEAISRNKTVLASDIPVFKEVGKKYPYYFSLNSLESLMDHILSFERGAVDITQKRARPSLLSWEASTNQLAEALRSLLQA